MLKLNVRIQELRKDKNLSAKSLAQEFKVTERTVHRWESGERVPPIETIVDLAKFFDVSTDYLLGLTDAP